MQSAFKHPRLVTAVLLLAAGFCVQSCNTTDPVIFYNVKSLTLSGNLPGGTEGKPGVEYRFEATHTRVTIPIVYEWNFDDSLRILVRDSAVIRHTFSHNGLYAVLIRVLNWDTKEELARKSMVVNIRDTVPVIDMVRIKGGTFSMGSTKLVDPSEQPVHGVTITRNLMVSRFELRQKEWNMVMPTSGSWFSGDSLPAESMSWYEAVDFCNRLSIRSGLTPAYSINGDSVQCFFSANGYRLPSEAEWEYLARAGTTTDFYSGQEQRPYSGCLSGDSLEPVIDSIAWYCLNSGGTTHIGGQKAPNAFGLYDMVGNVAEWTYDWFDSKYYQSSGSTDPVNTSPTLLKGARGGNAFLGTIDIRIPGRRVSKQPSLRFYGIGIRLVRTVP